MFRFRFALSTVLLLALIGCGGITPIKPIEKESTVTSTPKENQAFINVPTLTATGISKAVETVFDVASSRDKQNIAVFTSEGIYLYDSATLSLQRFIEFQTEIPPQNYHLLSPSITFSPDGKRLVFSDKNWLFSWDIIEQKKNERKYLSISAIPDWNISQIEYSPKGDRIMITTYGDYDRCEGTGVNFALYDIEFDLLFDHYFCTFNLENYYRFTSDNKVYIFYNHRSMFFPLEFYNIELSTGNVIEETAYDLYSGTAKNFIYDISLDGKEIAVGNYINYQLTTKIVDAISGAVLQEVNGGVDLSIEGIGKNRREDSIHVLNEKCNIQNQPNVGNQYTALTENNSKLLLIVSDWYPFTDWKNIKSLELWDVSTCEVEKTIKYE
jgi:hypothetical protein